MINDIQVVPHYRVFASSDDEAAAKAWARFPHAKAIEIRYLYFGWYEYTVYLEESA